jgi:hypothetical protein
VTVPDNTEFAVGQRFTKTWRIKNTGTCEWGPGYRLTFIDGDRMDAPEVVTIPETAPGESAEVSVPLVAPSQSGQHRGDWRICVNDECFGDTVYLQIISQSPTATPESTSTSTEEVDE